MKATATNLQKIHFFERETLPKRVVIIESDIQEEDESDGLQGEGLKIIFPFSIFDIWTRSEFLLGLKLSGHTDTLTDAGNLKDVLYRKVKCKTKNNIDMLMAKLVLIKWKLWENV